MAFRGFIRSDIQRDPGAGAIPQMLFSESSRRVSKGGGFGRGTVRQDEAFKRGFRPLDDNSDDASDTTQGSYKIQKFMDRELLSKTLSVDQKRFNLYLKQNDFGRFVRIVEKSKLGDSKNRVIIPEELMSGLLEILSEYTYYIQDKKYFSMNSAEYSQGPNDGLSDILVKKSLKQHSKTIFIELRENNMGRFVKITSLLRQNKHHIIVPAAGIAALQSMIDLMIRELRTLDNGSKLQETIEVPNPNPITTNTNFTIPITSSKTYNRYDTHLSKDITHSYATAEPANSNLESISNLYVQTNSQKLHFDVLNSSDQKLELRIKDVERNKSITLSHEVWRKCLSALEVLIEKYPPAPSPPPLDSETVLLSNSTTNTD